MGAQASYREGDEVFVVVRGGTAGLNTEQEGIVTETTGKGCFVKLKRGGNRNFFYLNSIRRRPATIEVPQKPQHSRAPFKLADVAKIVPPKNFEPKPETFSKPPGVPPTQTIGEIIWKIRQDCGAMQEPFARAIGVSAVTLSAYERGLEKPKDDHLLKLAEVFDVELTLLIDANERWSSRSAAASSAAGCGNSVPPTNSWPQAKTAYLDETSMAAAGVPGKIAVERFQAFVEQLADMAPIPAESSERHQWFERARGFFWSQRFE